MNGLRQFCGYQYFCDEILFYLVSLYSPLFQNLLNQNLHICLDPKIYNKCIDPQNLHKCLDPKIYTNVQTPKKETWEFRNNNFEISGSVYILYSIQYTPNRLSSTIGGNREICQLYTPSQVSNITRKSKFSHIS